jgi:anti-sigma factor ChrR (cupin superfamily)
VTKPERAMVEALMTYVDTATERWTELEPGYRRQTLVNDRESGTRIVLLQYDAGYELSYLDEHEQDEYLYILSGTFVDQHQASGPGTFIHNRPGSSHQPSSPDGCTFLAVVTGRSPHAAADAAPPRGAPVQPAPPAP